MLPEIHVNVLIILSFIYIISILPVWAAPTGTQLSLNNSNSISQIDDYLLHRISTHLPPIDLVNLRTVARQFRALSVRTDEWFARQRIHVDPFAMYRWCIQHKGSTAFISKFPSIPECWSEVDIWHGTFTPPEPVFTPLIRVQIQTLYDVVYRRFKLNSTESQNHPLELLLTGASTWTTDQRRSVLFHTMNVHAFEHTMLTWNFMCSAHFGTTEKFTSALVPIQTCLQAAYIMYSHPGVLSTDALSQMIQLEHHRNEFEALIQEYEAMKSNCDNLLMSVDQISYSLNQCPDVNHATGTRTALMQALVYGIPKDKALAETLLEKGADINQSRSFDKASALIAAAKTGDLESVRFLLANGADPNLKDWRGKTAYMHASIRKYPEIVQALQTYGGH